jgi:arylsulfatase A-like enzyme
MSRVIALLAYVALAHVAVMPAAAAERKPNIVVIVADDLGYADLGCQGSKEVVTPHIDSIAKNGVRFTSGYVSCPVCSPTRAGIMTGRYQQRFGHEFNPGPATDADDKFGLPLSEKTLADRLKAAGYQTGMVGKWHLGYRPEYHPMKRGFDEYFGFLGGAHAYLPGKGMKDNPILRGTQEVDEREYLTDAFTREAVAYIERHKEQPFFLYLTYNAVHAPLQAIEKYRQRVPKDVEGKRATYLAMLTSLDDGVGAVLAKLREAKLEEDTLVFFVSDNGGPTQATTSRNDPLRATKTTVWEGGIRVPFMVEWKSHLPANKVYDQPLIALDIAPTALSAAGEKLPDDAKYDGVNLLPFLTGKMDQAPHEKLFWRFGPQSAIRAGDWKLVSIRGTEELFNLAEDIGEKKNLAAQKPEKLKELHDALKAWDAQLAEPLWSTQRKGKD